MDESMTQVGILYPDGEIDWGEPKLDGQAPNVAGYALEREGDRADAQNRYHQRIDELHLIEHQPDLVFVRRVVSFAYGDTELIA